MLCRGSAIALAIIATGCVNGENGPTISIPHATPAPELDLGAIAESAERSFAPNQGGFEAVGDNFSLVIDQTGTFEFTPYHQLQASTAAPQIRAGRACRFETRSIARGDSELGAQSIKATAVGPSLLVGRGQGVSERLRNSGTARARLRRVASEAFAGRTHASQS